MSVFMRRTPLSNVAPPPVIQIAISASPTSGSVTQALSIDVDITLVRTNFTGDVALTATGLPAGASASFVPSTLSGATLTSVMTILTSLSTPVATTGITVVASGSGVSNATTPFALDVTEAGDFGFLRNDYTLPAATSYGVGCSFNSVTGLFEGTSLDHTEPTWASTSVFTDTGNAVTNVTNLNSLINTLHTTITGHTKISIPAGTAFSGSINLLSNTTGFRIGIITANFASLPAASTGTFRGTSTNRVAPADTANMFEMYPTTNNVPPFQASTSAQGYYIRGAYINNKNHFLQQIGLISLYIGVSNTSSDYPEDIIFAQCVIDGGDTSSNQYTKRGFYLSGRGCAVVDSYFDHGGIALNDAQGINVGPGEGPFKLVNNYIKWSGDSENIMIGGVNLYGTQGALNPADIEICGNSMDKDTWGNHKNSIEIKMGVRVLIDGNKCSPTHNRNGQQAHIVIKCGGEDFGNNYIQTSDVTCTNNLANSGPAGIVYSGPEYIPAPVYNVTRLDFKNNLMYGFNSTADNGYALAIGGRKVDDVIIKYNTLVGRYGANYTRAVDIFSNNTPHETNTNLQYNVMVGNDSNSSFVLNNSSGAGLGQVGFAASITGGTFADNLVSTATGDALYTLQIRAGSVANIRFTTPGSDFQLLNTSLGYQAGPDGQDLGFQKAIFDAVQARV